MLNCKNATKLLSESLERTLPLSRRMGLKMHLLMCRFCARFEKQIKFMSNITRRHEKQCQEEDTPSPDFLSLSPEARERMKKALRENKD